MFHGARSSGPASASSTGLARAASQAGFISVYPDANGSYWARPSADDQNEKDMIFVRRLLAQLDSALCVDDSHVYGTGGSNGAGFLTRVACLLGDRFTAIAPVAGVYRPLPTCRPHHPVSLLEIHGTGDRTAPYDPSNPTDPMGKIGVYSLLDAWFIWDQCPAGAPTWRRLGPRALWLAKSGCAGGTTVAHVKLIGEPHAWPTASTSSHPHGVGFDATQAIIQFFQTGTVSFPLAVSHGHSRRASPRPRNNEPVGGRAAPAATSRTT
jgi:polyhydroxybutyrate depolymerase